MYEGDASQIFFSTCFHCVHINCYPKLDKSGSHFNCLLCLQQNNILIPRNFDESSKRLLQLCNNIIIANFVRDNNCIEVDSLFILLFKHLVSSKSLRNFCRGPKRPKQSVDKIDAFAENLIHQIYQHSE